MNMAQIERIVLAVADSESAMGALPEEVRNSIILFKKENEERIMAEERRREVELKREAEKARQREEALRAERDKLLCKGTWGERVPRYRRFALCERTRYDGSRVYCAIDLVRGAKSPYWGYFDSPTSFYEDRLAPVYEAEDEARLLRLLREDWDFFFIDGRSDETEWKFCVLSYEVNGNGKGITILSRGEAKTWREHRDALKEEFGNTDQEGGEK